MTVLAGCLAFLAFAALSIFLLLRFILPAAASRKAENAFAEGRLQDAVDLFASAGTFRGAYSRAAELAYSAQTDNSVREALKNARTGDLVPFGRYEQNGNPEDGAEPVLWRVIRTEAGRILLLSEYVLEEMPYDPDFGEITWERCSLREWANGGFLETAFPGPERLLIVRSDLKNGSNPVTGAKGGKDTSDRIFLLGFDDLIGAARENALDVFSLKAAATEAARKNGLETDPGTGACCWWLRTPGKEASYVMYVDMSGSVLHYARPNYPGYGFRPALWIFAPG